MNNSSILNITKAALSACLTVLACFIVLGFATSEYKAPGAILPAFNVIWLAYAVIIDVFFLWFAWVMAQEQRTAETVKTRSYTSDIDKKSTRKGGPEQDAEDDNEIQFTT